MNTFTARGTCHEAGHAVVALHFGFRAEGIWLREGRLMLQVPPECDRDAEKWCVFLAGGIAAEQLVFGKYDVEGSTDDRNKIGESCGGAIGNYLAEAERIIRSHESCLQQLRKELLVECMGVQGLSQLGANPAAASEDSALLLLSRDRIEDIWKRCPQNA